MNGGSVVFRPQESALFGIPVLSTTVATHAEFDEALASSSDYVANQRALLVLRVPAEAIATAQYVEAAGGRLCDTLVNFSRMLESDVQVDRHKSNGIIRDATDQDSTSLFQLASRAFHGFRGHWHADSSLDPSACDRLYAQWARDLVLHSATDAATMLAPTNNGEIAGFLSLAAGLHQTWSVPLTAVDPDHRGKGILRAMLASAAQRVADAGGVRLDYETQLSNAPAIRVVSQLGFSPVAARFTFHLWTSGK